MRGLLVAHVAHQQLRTADNGGAVVLESAAFLAIFQRGGGTTSGQPFQRQSRSELLMAHWCSSVGRQVQCIWSWMVAIAV